MRYIGHKIYLFLAYVICVWLFESNSKYVMPGVSSAEDVTTSSIRLIPYHSLLSSMFQPVSRRKGKGLFSDTLNNIFPSRRNRRPSVRYPRPPPKFHNGIRRFKYQRPRPERNRYPLRKTNTYSKNFNKSRYPPRKPHNSFVPGGIVIDVQPQKMARIR